MMTRDFLLLNFIVLLLNAGLGIYINLGAILMRSSSARERFIILSEARSRLHSDNDTIIEAELFPAENSPTEYGVQDISANFTWHPFIWPAKNWIEVTSNYQVCLATQTSVDRLFWLSWQAESWSGPLSVSVFAPGSDLGVAIAMINYLRKCFPGILERTSLHLAYPFRKPAYIADRQGDYSQLDCNVPESVNKQLLKLRDSKTTTDYRYPQNFLRNIARRTCHTKYSFTVDIDMLVVPSMADSLESFLSTRAGSCTKCTFVVPAYEIHKNVEYPPEGKEMLLQLIRKKQARRFHVKVYDKNQGNSQLDRWEVIPPVDSNASVIPSINSENIPIYRVMYNISTYEEFWEPLLILPASAPGFDERFIGYGFTRSSQVYELKLRGYSFSIIDRAFLSHRGFQTTASYTPYRKAQIQFNKIRYQAFKRELHARLDRKQPKPLAPSPEELAILASHKMRTGGEAAGVSKQNKRKAIFPSSEELAKHTARPGATEVVKNQNQPKAVIPSPGELAILAAPKSRIIGTTHVVNKRKNGIVAIKKIPAIFRNLQDT